MVGLIILALVALIALIIGGFFAVGAIDGIQVRQVRRLFAILRNDAAARLQDERDHQATMEALRETREPVASGAPMRIVSDQHSSVPPRQLSRLPRLVGALAVLVGLLGLGGAIVAAVRASSHPVLGVSSSAGAKQPTSQYRVPAPSRPATTLVTVPQPAAIGLRMDDFTSACRHPSQYGDPAATAQVVPNSNEPPSYWVKCFHGDQMLGGLNLNAYCEGSGMGSYSDNAKRYDDRVADQPWLSWACIRG